MPGDAMQRVRDFLLPAFETIPSLDFYQIPTSAALTATSSLHQQPIDLSQHPKYSLRHPFLAPHFFGLFNPCIPPFLDFRRPQMPRAPHIELRGTHRLSPANPTTMAVETRQANMTSPIRPHWDPHQNIKIEDTKTPSFSKLETSSGAFKPIQAQNHQQRSSPSPSPPPQPKTVSVTVIQPNSSNYTTSAISSTVTSATESCRPSSRSPVLERTSGPRELGYHQQPSFSPYPAADPTYSLHVAVEVHRATQQDADGDTPLHIAISQADELDISLIRHLINLVCMSGRSVDIFNYIQQTPLHVAVITDNVDITRLLLEAGANPNETDRNGLTAVHHACVNNSIVCLKTIIDRSKFTVDMNARNYNGFAALHATVMENNMQMTNALLQSGASVEVQDAKNGWAPLFHAVLNKNETMITRLIEAGANVNAQSYSGNTALHIATGRGYTDVVRLLMRYGADMSVKNTHRDTPVEVSNNTMISSILQGRGPNYEQDRRPSETPSPYRSEPSLRIPTRSRTMTSQHPLSLAESLHPHRLPSARNPGKQSPVPLVKHARQSTSKRRGRSSHSPAAKSPKPSHEQLWDKLPSPEKLIIDESHTATRKSPDSVRRETSSPSHAKSCRVSVIVERQPLIKDNFSSTILTKNDSKPSEKMPLVSQMLQDNGGAVNRETMNDNFTLQTLPNSTHSSKRGSLSKQAQMPILEPVSPMETSQSYTHSQEAPNLASIKDSSCQKRNASLEPPLSPAIEMSDSEDEDAVTPPASPKAKSKTVTCENEVSDTTTQHTSKSSTHDNVTDNNCEHTETRVFTPSPKPVIDEDIDSTKIKPSRVTEHSASGCSGMSAKNSSETKEPPAPALSNKSENAKNQNREVKTVKRSHDSAFEDSSSSSTESEDSEDSKRFCQL